MAGEVMREDGYVKMNPQPADLNPGDTVYRSLNTKRLLKLRVRRITDQEQGSQFGTMVFEVSGSVCGPDGKALPHKEGHMIAPPSRKSVHADQPVDLSVLVDLWRMEVAAITDRAASLEEAALDF